MEIEVNRNMGRQGFRHGRDVYSGVNQLGYTLDIFADSVRFLHVARHGIKFLGIQD